MNRIEIKKLSETSKLSVSCVEKFDEDISELMKIAVASEDKTEAESGIFFDDLRDDTEIKTESDLIFSNVPNKKNGYILTARVDGV